MAFHPLPQAEGKTSRVVTDGLAFGRGKKEPPIPASQMYPSTWSRRTFAWQKPASWDLRPHKSWVLGSPQPLLSLLTRFGHVHIKNLIYVQNAITWGGRAALWA